MANFSVKVDKKFKRDLNRMIRKFPKEIDEALFKTAAFASKRIIKATPVKTGAARQSWNIRKKRGVVEVVSDTGRGSKYTPYLEFGTGRYGPKKRDIKPKAAKFLNFPIIKGNTIKRWVKTKSVKGIKPVGMIKKNLKAIEEKRLIELKKAIDKMWRGL